MKRIGAHSLRKELSQITIALNNLEIDELTPAERILKMDLEQRLEMIRKKERTFSQDDFKAYILDTYELSGLLIMFSTREFELYRARLDTIAPKSLKDSAVFNRDATGSVNTSDDLNKSA